MVWRRNVSVLSAAVVAAVLAVGVLAVGVLTLGPGTTSGADARASSARAAARPDIVLVLMDDFSLELLATMPQGRRMQREGAEFANAFVVDSLCCPSRAATLSGLPPHLNGVRTNTSGGPGGHQGGYAAFAEHGHPHTAFNVSLEQAGYRTGFVGKYLNEYEPARFGGTLPVLPGWTDIEAVTGAAYNGWGFDRFQKQGTAMVPVNYPRPEAGAPTAVKDASYAGTVIADAAVGLAERYEAAGDPYFLYVAPYATHESIKPAWPGEPLFPPAFRDRPGGPSGVQGNCGRRACTSLTVRDLPGFGDRTADNRPVRVTKGGGTRPAPSWRFTRHRMSAAEAERHLRDRARMAQSIDRMVARLRRAVGDDAYVLLTSDNGFHLGQHGLGGGKGTPYDSDVHVPLLVTGPGIERGRRGVVTTNLDLAPTIEDLAGARPVGARAGSSLVPALRDRRAGRGRYAFVEHTHGPVLPGEPDADAGTGGRLDAIPSYVAVRSRRGLLVRLDVDDDWERQRFVWELYDYRTVGWERRNTYAAQRREPWVRDLTERLRAWSDCATAQCRRLAS